MANTESQTPATLKRTESPRATNVHLAIQRQREITKRARQRLRSSLRALHQRRGAQSTLLLVVATVALVFSYVFRVWFSTGESTPESAAP